MLISLPEYLQQLEPSRNRVGHGLTPPSASPPPPPGSLTAPRPVQRERKRSPEGKGDGRPASIQSVARLSSPASESAPGLGAPPLPLGHL